VKLVPRPKSKPSKSANIDEGIGLTDDEINAIVARTDRPEPRAVLVPNRLDDDPEGSASELHSNGSVVVAGPGRKKPGSRWGI
jgi:hypothetical protein